MLLRGKPTRQNKPALLTELRRQGVFMTDLKPDPVDGTRLDHYVSGLVRRARKLDPDHIILIKVDVYDVAFEALRAAGLPVVNERIAFPSTGRQHEFAQGMRRALRNIGWD